MNAILPDVIFQSNCVLDSTFQNEGPDSVPVPSENEPGGAGKSVPGDLSGSQVWLTKEMLGRQSEGPGTNSLAIIQCVAPGESKVAVARHQPYPLKAIRQTQFFYSKKIF